MTLRETTILDFPLKAERLEVCLRAARRLEDLGEFEKACELLESHWRGPGHAPRLEGLSPVEASELLSCAGSLTAGLGSKKQIKGWQEIAKDLLTQASACFELDGNIEGWAQAQKSLAVCYWREGAISEGRIVVLDALRRLPDAGSAVALKLQVVLAILEINDGRNREAIHLLEQVSAQIEALDDDLLRGRFHNELGNARENLGQLDEAIIEATAAAHHYDRAGYHRGRVLALNALANRLRQSKAFDDAHRELDAAEIQARELGDDLHLGHLLDTRAIVLLDEGRIAEAEKTARQSVAIFRRGDETAYLVRSLRTLARCEKQPGRLRTYVRAYELAAERIGSREASEIAMEIIRECAGEVCLGEHVTLDHARREFEAAIIRRVLEETGGNVSAAAIRLGHSQQNLEYVLKHRHQDIEVKRKPGRRSLMKSKADDKSKAVR